MNRWGAGDPLLVMLHIGAPGVGHSAIPSYSNGTVNGVNSADATTPPRLGRGTEPRGRLLVDLTSGRPIYRKRPLALHRHERCCEQFAVAMFAECPRRGLDLSAHPPPGDRMPARQLQLVSGPLNNHDPWTDRGAATHLGRPSPLTHLLAGAIPTLPRPGAGVHVAFVKRVPLETVRLPRVQRRRRPAAHQVLSWSHGFKM